jgi:type II secretory pathway component PulF
MTARQRAQFFHELAQLARSGMTLGKSLEIMGGRRGGSALAHHARRLAGALQGGSTVSGAFLATGFPASDGAVIEAGETTGRLDQVYAELEEYYTQVAEARRQILSRSAYPLVVLHLGIFLLAIPRAIIAGSATAYWAAVLPVLAVVYGVALGVWFGWKVVKNLVGTRPVWARAVLAVPVFGGFLADWTAWKFTSVLALHVRAGGSLLRAIESAGTTCGNALLRQAALDALHRVRADGCGLSEAFRAGNPIPETLERAITVGEEAGRLDEETHRAADIFKQRTLQRLEAIGEWTPKILYIIVVLYTGWQIVQMATGVASSVGDVLEM